MKKTVSMFFVVMLVLCLSAGDLDAQGKRGGGRGGGRGGAAVRSRPSPNHGPSASRSVSGANRQPSSRNTRQFLNLPHAAATHPIAGRSAVAHSGHVDRNQINRQHANRYAGVANRPFNPGWHGWQTAHLPAYWHHRHHGYYRPGYWWHWATVGAVSGWIIYDWATPAYYAYGPGGNVYYEGDIVYVNGQPAYSGEEYYQQAANIADSVPKLDEEKAKQIEWMPLGVFAVVQDGKKESGLMLQLAVSKEGIISGTMFNESEKSVRAVEGMVDRKTQRAVWSFVDGKKAEVFMETGVFNLTKEETTALVHIGPKDTQVWTLVRLDEPAGDAALEKSGAAAPQPPAK